MRGTGHRSATSRWAASILFVAWMLQAPPPPLASSPLAPPAWPLVGLASWYSTDDPGVTSWTAAGEAFDDGRLTAAMWGLPFGSCLHVTNLDTFQHVDVFVNDRGPHQRLVQRGRVIDLSRAAFASIGALDDGLIPVRLELLDGKRCGAPAHG